MVSAADYLLSLSYAMREPVKITKNGRAAVIMLPTSDKELISAMEGFLEER